MPCAGTGGTQREDVPCPGSAQIPGEDVSSAGPAGSAGAPGRTVPQGGGAAGAAPYRSPFEAYPFLSEPPEDLRCDFELLTDGIASLTGLLRSQVREEALREELAWVEELVYHLNPTLRTRLTVTQEEIRRLQEMTQRLEEELAPAGFVLPLGGGAACTAHLLRVACKGLVRLLYRHAWQGHAVPEPLTDACNLLSQYFFLTALRCNAAEGVAEVPFVSRNYPGGRGTGAGRDAGGAGPEGRTGSGPAGAGLRAGAGHPDPPEKSEKSS